MNIANGVKRSWLKPESTILISTRESPFLVAHFGLRERERRAHPFAGRLGFLPAVEVGEERLELAEADRVDGLRVIAAAPPPAIASRPLAICSRPLAACAAPDSAALGRLLDRLGGLLRRFLCLLLLGALAAAAAPSATANVMSAIRRIVHRPRSHGRAPEPELPRIVQPPHRQTIGPQTRIGFDCDGVRARLRGERVLLAPTARLRHMSDPAGRSTRRAYRTEGAWTRRVRAAVSESAVRESRTRAGMPPDAPHCWRIPFKHVVRPFNR